jgi:hypothetical protein
MKYIQIYSLIIVISLFGCNLPPPIPPKTQLQIRELQTREYPSKDLKQVMKAVIGALQDDGFLIRNADKELGFINALREYDVMDPNSAFVAQLFEGSRARYEKTSIIEASANVSDFGRNVRVRIVFQVKIIDNFGMPIDSRTVEDAKMYQDFFVKVDKSVFIERQGL